MAICGAVCLGVALLRLWCLVCCFDRHARLSDVVRLCCLHRHTPWLWAQSLQDWRWQALGDTTHALLFFSLSVSWWTGGLDFALAAEFA